jgi:fumarate reductase subunit D
MGINVKKASSLIVFFFFFIFINKAAALDINLVNPLSTSDFNKLVGNTLQWVLSVAGSVALIMLIFGGVAYITAAGDEQRITMAKRTITWAILGLAVVLTSYAIIAVLNRILTG